MITVHRRSGLALSTLLLQALTAQQPVWLEHYGNAAGYNEGIVLAYDEQGFIYGTGSIAGPTDFDGQSTTILGDQDIFLVKWDTTGNVVWARTAGGTPGFQQGDPEAGHNVLVDPADGGVIVSGRFSSPDSYFGTHVLQGGSNFESDVFVARYDANGTCLWAKGAFSADAASAELLVDDISTVFSFGHSSQWGTSFYETDTATIPPGSFLAKYDADGTFISAVQTVYRGSIYDVKWLGNDWLVCGHLPVGSVMFGQPVAVQSPGSDGYVARVDTTGSVVWSTILHSDSAVIVNLCAPTSDGKAMIAGIFHENLYVGNDTLVGSSDSLNHFLAFVDDQGEVKWARKLMTHQSFPRDLKADANDQFYFVERFTGEIDLLGTSVEASTARDGLVARIDTTGTCVAAWHFGRVWGMRLASVVPTAHGLYIGCEYDSTMNFGTYTVPVSLPGYPDLFLARFDSLSGFTGVMRQVETNEALHIYANPNNGLCTIDLPPSLQASDGLVLSVYDNTGQLVQRTPLEFTEQGLKLDVRAQAKGVYHVELSDGAQRYSGSIVFE